MSEEALLLSVINQAVGLATFWPTVASHAPPATQLALAGTCRAARDAAVQFAPKATLSLKLSPPPRPEALAVLRNSGRTLPASIIITNRNGYFTPLVANSTARFMIPQLGCPAVTFLQLGGGTWLLDTALLAAISAALPGLSKLVLSNVTIPTHLPAPDTPTPVWPSLQTIIVDELPDIEDDYPERTDAHHAANTHMLAALGVRAGGGVINLTLNLLELEPVIGPMLQSNQLHALRKLCLPGLTFEEWGANEPGGALIRKAPALEHLKVGSLEWSGGDQHGTAALCVPWRILEVYAIGMSTCGGLPLGSKPGQPPLILRVWGSFSDAGATAGGVSVQHLLSDTPGKRRVQLECTRVAYGSICPYMDIPPILRFLTLTATGLSNLILDGIDGTDDIKNLVELGAVGLSIGMGYGPDWVPLDPASLEGLRDLPQVTKLEVRGNDWSEVDDHLLASLPVQLTDVRLRCQTALGTAGPKLDLVSRMCVHVSRLPHRQAHPLRLGVRGLVSWFDSVCSAVTAAGINAPGVVEVPYE